MKNAIRNGALALGLAAGAALLAAPSADARSIQRDGYFGGTWSPIGPKHNRYVKRHHRRHGPAFYAYTAPRGYYYGPGYYGYGPRYYRPRIGFGFSID
jgi:hypothetical protein